MDLYVCAIVSSLEVTHMYLNTMPFVFIVRHEAHSEVGGQEGQTDHN